MPEVQKLDICVFFVTFARAKVTKTRRRAGASQCAAGYAPRGHCGGSAALRASPPALASSGAFRSALYAAALNRAAVARLLRTRFSRADGRRCAEGVGAARQVAPHPSWPPCAKGAVGGADWGIVTLRHLYRNTLRRWRAYNPSGIAANAATPPPLTQGRH